MIELFKKLNANSEIKTLLNEFEKDFNATLDREDPKGRELLSLNRDCIFRQWLFSPIIDETYLTPAYIINNIAQKMQKGDYTVLPHIKITFTNNKLLFETKWIEYSENKNPVLEDLDILFNEYGRVITLDDNNPFLIENGEEFLEKINFRSSYYLQYLIDLSSELKFIDKMDSINCESYLVNSNYTKFNNLDSKEKIKLIIEHSIKISTKNIKAEYDVKNIDIKNDLLDNNIVRDNLDIYYIDKKDLFNNHLDDLLKTLTDYSPDVMENIHQLKDLLGSDAGTIFAQKEFGIIFDIHFTSVFAYYLGVINPIYFEPLYIKVFIMMLKPINDVTDYQSVLFPLEAGHDLSKNGEVLLKKCKIKYHKNYLFFKNDADFKDPINYYLYNKDEEIQENLSFIDDILKNNKISDDDLFDDNLFDYADTDDLYNVSPLLQSHIHEFELYLKEKKLTQKTVDKHCENVLFYIDSYLNITDLSKLEDITIDSIHGFLIDFYIPSIAAFKTNVSDAIASLNHYLKFLNSKNYINKDFVHKYKYITKNKDKYLDYFYSCTYGENY